jgi:hypothetical protein
MRCQTTQQSPLHLSTMMAGVRTLKTTFQLFRHLLVNKLLNSKLLLNNRGLLPRHKLDL